MSSVRATMLLPGPSARRVRAPSEAKVERTRPGGGVSTYARASLSTRRIPLSGRSSDAAPSAGSANWTCSSTRSRQMAHCRAISSVPSRRCTGPQALEAGGVSGGRSGPVQRRVVRSGNARCGDGDGERPAGQSGDHAAFVGRQVVLHAAVPGGDGTGDERDVVGHDGPLGAVPVLAEHQPVPLAVRLEPQHGARLQAVVAENAGELRGREQHRREHEQCVLAVRNVVPLVGLR
jgi:hypothetical protein